MPALVRRSFMLALALGALTFSTACNRELRDHAEVFLASLSSSDYAKLETIASAELLAEVSEATFHEMAATYAELGPELDRTQTSTAINNGVRSVGFTLEHEAGEVQLTLTSHSEKLDGFKLEGPQWTASWVRRHHEALEALLGEVSKGEREPVRALVHASIPDTEIESLLQGVQPLGPVKSIELTDDRIPEFRVTYEKAEFDATLQLSRASIVRYSLRPAKGA